MKSNDTAPAGAATMPPEIPRDLLGKIVDEVFDGAIEDASVIEDIYRVIAREHAAPTAGLAAILTQAEIERGWHDTFSTGNPFCPCNLKSFTKAVNWAVAAISRKQVA